MKTYGFSTTTTTTTKTTTPSREIDQSEAIGFDFQNVPSDQGGLTDQIGSTGQDVSAVKEGLTDQDRLRDELGSVPTMSDNLLHVSVYFNTLNERKVETVEVYDVSLHLQK